MIQSLLPFLDILVRCTGPLNNCINSKPNLVLRAALSHLLANPGAIVKHQPNSYKPAVL